MSILRKDRAIPPEVLEAAKKAGFPKPDIYSGRLVQKPKRRHFWNRYK